ncbi:hypothetical protein CP532_1254 [Ophiocordyceps camponoti-leonardi (nom. inval.)]|nr:hypothetical protein CP532_1254 [Ophiocordyceps camponoti-leonardi (nom. inval.)]
MAHIIIRPPQEEPVIPGTKFRFVIGGNTEREDNTLVLEIKVTGLTPQGDPVPARILQQSVSLVEETEEHVANLEYLFEENEELRRELGVCRFKIADMATDHQELTQVKGLLRAHEMGLIKGQFHDKLLRQGAMGGRSVAKALQATVADHFGNRLGRFEVIVRIMVDFDRLAKALGGGDIETRLRDFARGITETPAMFKFVSLQQRIDLASNRLHEMADWHLRNDNCRHVMLGLKGTDANIGYLHKLIMTGHKAENVSIFPTEKLLETATGVFGIIGWTGEYFRGHESGTDGGDGN